MHESSTRYMHSSGTQFKKHNFCHHRSTFPPLADTELAQTYVSRLQETWHKPVHRSASTKSRYKTMTNWELMNWLKPEDNHVECPSMKNVILKVLAWTCCTLFVVQVSVLQLWSKLKWTTAWSNHSVRKDLIFTHNVSVLGSVGRRYTGST